MSSKMRTILMTAAIVFPIGVFAGNPVAKHPNLVAADKALATAWDKISAAQKANEFDMDGHAAKAKDAIKLAVDEIKLAAEAANKNADVKKDKWEIKKDEKDLAKDKKDLKKVEKKTP